MLFQCSAPHSTAAAPAPCPEGALDFLMSVTSCLLSGRDATLQSFWVKGCFIPQNMTVWVQGIHPPKAGWSTAQHIPQYKAPLPWRFLHNPYHVGDSLFPDKGSRYHEQTNTLWKQQLKVLLTLLSMRILWLYRKCPYSLRDAHWIYRGQMTECSGI